MADRAAARALRADERVLSVAARHDARVEARARQAEERERVRNERRDAERALAAKDPHTAALRKHRSAGRKDIVREERDTTGYAMVVDEARIRALAGRGATIGGLAAVFSVSEEDIRSVLAQTES